MSPMKVIRSGLKKVLVFEGRASRAEYWWYSLSIVAAAVLLTFVASLVVPDAFDWAAEIIFLAVTILVISVTLRRLFDRSLPKPLAYVLAFAPAAVYCVDLIVWGFEGPQVPQLVAEDLGNSDALRDKVIQSYLWAAFYAVSAIMGLVTFILALLPSKAGTNKYGPNPNEVPS